MLHLKVKIAGQVHEQEAEPDWTVEALKAMLEEPSNMLMEHQRLVYRGKVLRDPDTLEQAGVADGGQIHLVRGAGSPAATPAAASGAPSGGAAGADDEAAGSARDPATALAAAMGGGGGGGRGGMSAQMASTQAMLRQNPDMMRQAMESPVMQGLMQDPELMRQMMMSHPQMRQMAEDHP
jgi:ubiquilin